MDWPVHPASALAQDLTGSKVAASYWSFHPKPSRSMILGVVIVFNIYLRLFLLQRKVSRSLKSAIGKIIGDHSRRACPYDRTWQPIPMDQVRFMRNAQSVSSDLTEVSPQIDLKPRVKGPDYSERYFESMFRIMSPTTKLKHLAFGVTQWGFGFDAHDTQ